MSDKFTVTGCKHLDYITDFTNCEKQVISGTNGDKVFWFRKNPDPDLPTMVQFCKKRGRINCPKACTVKHRARCGDYVEHEHLIPISQIN